VSFETKKKEFSFLVYAEGFGLVFIQYTHSGRRRRKKNDLIRENKQEQR
jgi:hypothetical protein